MTNFEKTHQFLSAYENLQSESFSDTQFDEHNLTVEHVHWLDSCTSTSEYIKEKLSSGLKNPIICISDIQTEGKGQRDKTWHSPLGNLYMSLYLPIQEHLSHAQDMTTIDGRLALETAIALLGMPMLQTAKLNPNFKVGIKWPNDLCTLPRSIEQAQVLSKFTGILIEPVSVKPKQSDEQEVTLASLPRLCGVIIGVGINANETETTHIDGRPINNLQNMLGHTVSIPDLAAQVCQACQKSLSVFHNHGSSLPVRYFSHDLLYDKAIEVEQFNGKIQGIATGIQADGTLTVMENIEKTHTLYDGKITLLPVS